MRELRVNWRLKALLPVAGVLLLGIYAFLWITLTMEPTERRQVLLVATGGVLPILAVLLVVLAVLIQRPLMEMQEKIARLQKGDLNVSVNFAKRNDEIGDLGKNFNETVRRLRESRQQIERMHRTQMSRAEHLATLGEMAAGLAHEIRNPLAGIAGVIEIVGKEIPESSPNRQIFGELQHEILHIQQVLSDLLNYARPKPPRFKAGNLNDTAEHAVAMARQQSLSRPVEIKLVRDDSLPPVEHDEAQIQQAILNLLLNSLQAIDGAGRIIVEISDEQPALGSAEAGSCARVTITDTGRGIDRQHLEKLFRPFFTTKGTGTGLGLSLVRRSVEDHGGKIEVQSKMGEGSRFTIRLPFRRPEPEA